MKKKLKSISRGLASVVMLLLEDAAFVLIIFSSCVVVVQFLNGHEERGSG